MRERGRRSPGRAASSGTQSAASHLRARAPSRGRPRGRRARESTRSLRRRSSTRPLFESAGASVVADELLRAARRRRSPSGARPPPSGSAIATSRAVEQLAQPVARRARAAAARSISLDERVADLVQRLELARPARRRLVEARVLDRDRGLRGEQRDELLVLLGEVAAAVLLGQVEVPVGDAAQQDRHAEEGVHRRVVRAGSRPSAGRRARSCRRSGRASRDQHAEDAAPARQVADRRVRLGVDPVREEALERAAGRGRSRRARRSARSVSSAAVSTTRWSTASSESSELSAIPVSISVARPVVVARARSHYRVAAACGSPQRVPTRDASRARAKPGSRREVAMGTTEPRRLPVSVERAPAAA